MAVTVPNQSWSTQHLPSRTTKFQHLFAFFRCTLLKCFIPVSKELLLVAQSHRIRRRGRFSCPPTAHCRDRIDVNCRDRYMKLRCSGNRTVPEKRAVDAPSAEVLKGDLECTGPVT
jgi:hypothetical protein